MITGMVVLAGCSRLGGGAADGADEPGAEAPGADAGNLGEAALDDETIAALGLEQLGEVIRMQPGGSAPFPRDMLLPGPDQGQLIGQRHVLRLVTVDGPVDLFEYRLNVGGQGLQLCRALVDGRGAGAGCGPNDTPEGANGMIGLVSSGDRQSMAILDGPAGMTHFVATVGERTVVLVPVDTLAVLAVPGDLCSLEMTLAAWQDDELLATGPVDPC